MEAFEYFVVLSSLILGLGITQILTGVSDLVAHFNSVRFSLTHSIYALVVFIIHLQEWWYSYQYSLQIENWTLLIALGLMTFHIVLFLQARILFPTGARSQETDMIVYYGQNWRLLYALGSVTIVISVLQNILISDLPISGQYFQLIYFFAYMAFIFFNIKNFYAHVIFVSLQLIIWIVLIVNDPFILN